MLKCRQLERSKHKHIMASVIFWQGKFVVRNFFLHFFSKLVNRNTHKNTYASIKKFDFVGFFPLKTAHKLFNNHINISRYFLLLLPNLIKSTYKHRSVFLPYTLCLWRFWFGTLNAKYQNKLGLAKHKNCFMPWLTLWICILVCTWLCRK